MRNLQFRLLVLAALLFSAFFIAGAPGLNRMVTGGGRVIQNAPFTAGPREIAVRASEETNSGFVILRGVVDIDSEFDGNRQSVNIEINCVNFLPSGLDGAESTVLLSGIVRFGTNARGEDIIGLEIIFRFDDSPDRTRGVLLRGTNPPIKSKCGVDHPKLANTIANLGFLSFEEGHGEIKIR